MNFWENRSQKFTTWKAAKTLKNCSVDVNAWNDMWFLDSESILQAVSYNKRSLPLTTMWSDKIPTNTPSHDLLLISCIEKNIQISLLRARFRKTEFWTWKSDVTTCRSHNVKNAVFTFSRFLICWKVYFFALSDGFLKHITNMDSKFLTIQLLLSQTGVFSNTVVIQHHSVVMTKADKIYKVKCTYDMSSKNITFGMMPIR